ncbi:MAG: hypothetical protein M3T49_08450 [Candidatus Eremiobacteraeota bacterium]|nr:hypothetical protein [Candidatus Eremiobacteraeota bacterium]
MTTVGDSAVASGPQATYVVSDSRVLVGASLGNASAWLVCKATGALQKVFSLALGCDVFWSTVVTYGSPRHRVLIGLEKQERAAEEQLGQAGGHVTLAQVAPGRFEFHPGYQRHIIELPSSLRVTETVLVPRTGFDDPAVAYFIVDVFNSGHEPRDLVVHGYSKLRGTTPSDVSARYDGALRGLIASNDSQPDWVRIFACSRSPAGYQTMHHAEESYDPANVPPLSDQTDDKGNIIGALAARLTIQPGASETVAFVLVFSERGEAAAREIYRGAVDFKAALERTIAFYREALSASQVLTPEKIINDGARWSKVNMLRVIGRYPQGYAHTNDPGSGSAIVGRDLAWFAHGCDYLSPTMSRAMLLRFAQTQYESGKIPEFYHGVTGVSQDFGLNINDDTPLFILACTHHYQMSGDSAFFDEIWPVVCKATDYILEQRDHRGLVVCYASGEEVFGIAGWRNVIPHFTMSGAVTEINSECFAALRCAAKLAQVAAQRDPERAPELARLSESYGAGAQELREAINTHLINSKNGMYVLNIGLDGDVHADVTGDEVFPVMFGVAEPAAAYRIISRLNNPDFQTDAGLRTVSRLSPDYAPYRDSGLLGGVWPGLSFWYAFAAAKIYPDTMAHNLKQSYAQYLRDPKIYNTVPGQFSEWFDGESFINRGMRLSPWEPPRYLWAAIEGACGLNIDQGPQKYAVSPLMPSGWSWLGVRRVPLGGRELTYFVARYGAQKFRIYATEEIECADELEVYEDDVSNCIQALNPDIEVVALRRGGEILLCLGSTASVAYTFPLSLRDLIDESRTYEARLYNAELGRWASGETTAGRDLTDVSLRLDGQGYGLIRLLPR